MARDLVINGPTLVSVKGRSDLTNINTLTGLGLTNRNGIVTISFDSQYDDVDIDAWGMQPMDEQYMLSSATITMTLTHIDRSVLATCIAESWGGAVGSGVTVSGLPVGPEGTLTGAGSRLGNGVPRFSPAGTLGPNGNVTTGNHYIGLNITSPVANLPWRFFYAYLDNPTMQNPLGTKRSEFQLTWRAIPSITDPYNSGAGATGYVLFDHTLDNP